MSKAKLEFDLTDFDDKMEFERCIKSTDMCFVIFEMVYNMKKDCITTLKIKKKRVKHLQYMTV